MEQTSEHLGNIKEIYTLYDIKYKYPRNLLIKTLDKHLKKFVYFKESIKYYCEFVSMDKINNNIIEL